VIGWSKAASRSKRRIKEVFMIDHDPTHQRRMITSDQWVYFFQNLAQSHQGKAVRIQQGPDFMSAEAATATTTLEGLVYEHPGARHHLAITTGGEGGLQSVEINFHLVWSVFDRNSQVVAVECTDEKNRKVVLNFVEP
jgi:hypothetical protein